MEFILWCSILMDCSCFFLIHLKSMNGCNWMVILPLLKSHVWKICVIFIYLNPLPNGYMCCFNHLHNFKVLIPISCPITFIFERSLSGKKSHFLSESGFDVTLRFPFTTLGIFWVITNWHRFRGTRVQIRPGRNDKDYNGSRKYFFGKTKKIVSEEICTFSLVIPV